MDKLESSIDWWVSFAESILFEQQHYDDYLNDIDTRRMLGKQIHDIQDKKTRNRLLIILKKADNIFLKNTDSFPAGIASWTQSFHPDADWMFFRIPRKIGADFPSEIS